MEHQLNKISVKTKTGLDITFKFESYGPYKTIYANSPAGHNIGVMSFTAINRKGFGYISVEGTDVSRKYRNQGIGSLLQEYFISYLNGKYGIGNYKIETETTSRGGEKLFDYRSDLMFNPKQNIQTNSDEILLFTNVKEDIATKIDKTLALNGIESNYEEAYGYTSSGDIYENLFDIYVSTRLDWIKAHELLDQKFSNLISEAASPSYMGEYTFDQFKRVAKPGQIWQTSNSILRIDKLSGNRLTRRISRYLKFYGAFTGIGPRAIKALLPNRNGKFLSSAGPWSVSRKYEPFLLIKENVFEFEPTDDIVQNPDIDGVGQSKQPIDMNLSEFDPVMDRNQTLPEYELALPQNLGSLEPKLADLIEEVLRPNYNITNQIAQCKSAYTEFKSFFLDRNNHGNYLYQLSFNVKLYGVNIPNVVRQRLDEQTIQDEYDFDVSQAIEELFESVESNFPWLSNAHLTGRSDGWLIVDVSDWRQLFGGELFSCDLSENPDEFLDDAFADLTEELLSEYLSSPHITYNDIQNAIVTLNGIEAGLRNGISEIKKLTKFVELKRVSYIRYLSSMEFWQQVIDHRNEIEAKQINPIVKQSNAVSISLAPELELE